MSNEHDARYVAWDIEDAEVQARSGSGTDEALDNAYEAFRFTVDDGSSSASAANRKSLPTSVDVGGLRLRMRQDGNVTAGQLQVQLYTDDAGEPGTRLSGELRDHPESLLACVDLSTSFGEVEFFAPYTLSTNTDYWVVFVQVTDIAGGSVYLDRTASGTDEYARSADGSTWTVETAKAPWYALDSITDDGLYGKSHKGRGVHGESDSYMGGRFSSTYHMGSYSKSQHNVGVGGSSIRHMGGRFTSTDGLGAQGVSVNNLGGRFEGVGGVQGVATGSEPAVDAHAQGSGPTLRGNSTRAGKAELRFVEEEITLGGTNPKDGTTGLVPAGCLIQGVTVRVTEALADFGGEYQIGLAGAGANHFTGGSNLTDGSEGFNTVLYGHWDNTRVAYVGSAETLRVNCLATPTAGKLRVTVWYYLFSAATS